MGTPIECSGPSVAAGSSNQDAHCGFQEGTITEVPMGRGILLWLLGVPIPVIILLALFWH
jgi:hypothetical protein